MQPADIARTTSVADPALSPDGRRVAFTVSRVDLDANRYRSAVWLADVDGGRAPFPVTSGEHSDSAPRWSPDGARLAFARSVDGRGALWVLPVDGPGEAVRVCERAEAVESPAWSPDGSRIAFVSRERAARYAEGDDERARPPRRIDRLVSRVDGEGWTIDRPAGLFVVPADGSGEPVLVAGGPHDHGPPSWSPDGTSLATTVVPPDGDLDQRADLLVVDAAGGGASVRGGRRLHHTNPSWGPDGRIAVLVSDLEVVPSHSQVAVVSPDGEESVLTASLDRQCEPFPGTGAPVWTPEGLLFAVEEHGDVHLHRVPADGGAPERVLGGARAVRGYDAAAGVLAVVATTATQLPELHVVDAGGVERRLTGVSDAFLAAVPPVVPEALEVASPKGDGPVDAWVVRPSGPGPHPVLLSIHGGPMTQYSPVWFDEFQMWVAAGYAVVFANPHGSTGHTEAFSREIRAAEAAVLPGTGWAGTAAQDVLAALDAALTRHPELDAGRVGVLGGSYGGYLTTWLVANTDRFAAACSERAANNLESLETSSDAAGLFHPELGVKHLDAPEVYRAMSPALQAARIRTPVLILHSEDDLRCPPEQADQLFVALRMLGREVEYWRFPEEGHELSRSGSPRHRIQRAEIILDWFGRHLGGRRPTITWDHPSRA